MRRRTLPRRTQQLILLALAALTLTRPGPSAASITVAPAVDLCARTHSDRDLKDDGYDDAVVGDPHASVNGQREAGLIMVLYGDADRWIGEGRRVLMTQSGVMGTSVEAGDHFGWSIALADATRGWLRRHLGRLPGEDWTGHADAGIARLIAFTPDGSGGAGQAHRNVLDQSAIGGAVETGDQFGYAVALGNYPGSVEAAGAIGAPGEDVRGVAA